MDQLEADRNAAAVGRTVASQFGAVLQTGEKWLLSAPVAERVGLGDPSRDRGVAVVEAGGVEDLVGRVRDVTQHHEAVELYDDLVSTLRLGRRSKSGGCPSQGLAGTISCSSARGSCSRAARSTSTATAPTVPDLGLAGQARPAVTVTKRVLGRLTTRPGWLPRRLVRRSPGRSR